MKLHLPVRRLCAVATLITAALPNLTLAAEVPSSYTAFDVTTPEEVTDAVGNSADYAFLLQNDLTFSRVRVISLAAGSRLFTSADTASRSSLAFTSNSDVYIKDQEILTLLGLNELTFSAGASEFVNNYSGGAIFAQNSGSVAIEDNIKVVFSKNTSTSSQDLTCGGAIYSYNGTIALNRNENVIFSDNYSSSTYSSIYSPEVYGGAIYSYDGDITLSKNKSVIFNNNYATGSGSAHGGAIYNNSGTTTLSENESVTFEGNCTKGANSCLAGAILSSGFLCISENNVVTFKSNYCYTAGNQYSAFGGAIHIETGGEISKNKSVTFDGNYVSTASGAANGGAVFCDDTLTIDKNDSISFTNNYASTTSYTLSSNGGAIGSIGFVIINDNQNVLFEDNYSSGARFVTGGAISAISESLLFSENGSVIFNGNSAKSINSEGAYGGAIYAETVTIQGNDSVIFKQNYERHGNNTESNPYTYRLRGLYATGDVVLSASEGHFIEFQDSVYVGGSLALNSKYTNSNGETVAQTGDIIFSGKYTEDALKEVKGGIAGTAAEIGNSRTSEILSTVNLHAGTLRVEDNAVLKTHDVNLVAEGNATLKVLDAEVNAAGYNVTINSTGQLTLRGVNGSAKLTAKTITIAEGAALAVESTDIPLPDSVITLAEEDSVSIFNEKLGGIISGDLNLAANSTYKADGAHLSVIDGTLSFNSKPGNEINLILTLGAQYNEDSEVMLFTDVKTVKFVFDNITATQKSSMVTLNAMDYFSGDWINENTKLVYEQGAVYLVGVNRVVPEPATATLSLLALAALAVRRRRK